MVPPCSIQLATLHPTLTQALAEAELRLLSLQSTLRAQGSEQRCLRLLARLRRTPTVLH